MCTSRLVARQLLSLELPRPAEHAEVASSSSAAFPRETRVPQAPRSHDFRLPNVAARSDRGGAGAVSGRSLHEGPSGQQMRARSFDVLVKLPTSPTSLVGVTLGKYSRLERCVVRRT